MSAARRRSARATPLLDAAPLFAALGSAARLRLVSRLCAEGPQSIARLCEGSGVSHQATTKHLHVLEGAGLIRSERQGRESVWSIEPARLDDARTCLERISAQWDTALERLRSAVETDD